MTRPPTATGARPMVLSQPPAAGAYGYPVAMPARTSGKAIAALVLGIAGCVLWWLPFLGMGMIIVDILAIVFGVQARKEIRNSRGQVGGNGLAITGIVLGIVGLAFWAVVVLVIGLMFAALAGGAAAAA